MSSPSLTVPTLKFAVALTLIHGITVTELGTSVGETLEGTRIMLSTLTEAEFVLGCLLWVFGIASRRSQGREQLCLALMPRHTTNHCRGNLRLHSPSRERLTDKAVSQGKDYSLHPSATSHLPLVERDTPHALTPTLHLSSAT